MTSVIGCSCPMCGYMELPPAQLSLVYCERRPAWSYYYFVCPTCLDEVRKPADAETVLDLERGGIVAQQWVIPTEAFEEHHGRTISYDEILDFALRLESPLFTFALHPELAARGS